MDKRRFPKKDSDIEFFEKLRLNPQEPESPKPRLKNFSIRAFNIIKLILGICFLAFIYSATVAFLSAISIIEKTLQDSFWSGVTCFVIVYLFIYEPAALYKKGQRLLEIIFRFFAPLVRVAPYLLPIYTIIIFLAYLLAAFLFKAQDFTSEALFFLGFSLSMHLVFSAKSIRYKQGDFLKANYIFGFSFIYILNLILISFLLNIIFKEFAFIGFLTDFFQTGKGIFEAVFRQLFL